MPRTFQWIDRKLDGDLTTNGTLVVKLFDPEAQTRGVSHSTLTRIIYGVDLIPAAPGVVTGVQHISTGIGIGGVDAIDLGITALPNPASDSEFPEGGWLYRAGHVIQDGEGEGFRWHQRIDVDLGAKRLLRNGAIYMVLSNNLIVGTGFTCTVAGEIRMLVMRP